MCILSLLFPCKEEEIDKTQWNTNYSYVFVHGLMGWGKYDPQYKIMPYWGMFGGATIRVFASLMAQGNAAEIEATDKNDISPFFTGGKSDWIYSLTALAAPHNGTTAYGFENSAPENTDTAAYDMFIDHALELNKTIVTDGQTYYFSIPCTATTLTENGTYVADKNNIPKGTWNIMPTYQGDHMSLQGGLLKVNTDVEDLYTEHLNIINSLK